METNNNNESTESRRAFLTKGLAFLAGAAGLTSGCLDDMRQGRVDAGVDVGPDSHDVEIVKDQLRVQMGNVMHPDGVVIPSGARRVQLFEIDFLGPDGRLIECDNRYEIGDLSMNVSGYRDGDLADDITVVTGWEVVGDKVRKLDPHILEKPDGSECTSGYYGSAPIISIDTYSCDGCGERTFNFVIENSDNVVVSDPENVEVIGDFPIISPQVTIIDQKISQLGVELSDLSQDEIEVLHDAETVELFNGNFVGGKHDMSLNLLYFYLDGIVSPVDFTDFKLEINGQVLSEADMSPYTDEVVQFKLDNKYVVNAGEAVNFRLLATPKSISAGDTMNVNLYDVWAEDMNYGFASYPILDSTVQKVKFV